MTQTCIIWCEEDRLEYMIMPGNLVKFNRVFANDPDQDEELIFDMINHLNNAPTCSIYQFAAAIPRSCGVITCGLDNNIMRPPAKKD